MGGPDVRGFGRIELWVGNARHAASFFSHVLGFATVAGPGVGTDRVSYVLEQGDIQVVLTGATCADSPVADFVRLHGDGVRDVAFRVDDAVRAYELAIARGARPAPPPSDAGQPTRHGPRHAIAAFGDTTHTLADDPPGLRRGVPDSEPAHGSITTSAPVGLVRLDHLAVSVPAGERERWARHYEHAMGFQRVGPGDERIEIAGSAFSMSTVRARSGEVTLVFAEPGRGSRKSQIADYLDHFGGAGVHHIAFSTDDIVGTVSSLHTRGMRTLDAPAGYYQDARRRLDGIEVPWADLERLGVLVDRDSNGHLFQVFTQPLGDRPTVCLEIIQRAGTDGFGNDNIRALYGAVARGQVVRSGI